MTPHHDRVALAFTLATVVIVTGALLAKLPPIRLVIPYPVVAFR